MRGGGWRWLFFWRKKALFAGWGAGAACGRGASTLGDTSEGEREEGGDARTVPAWDAGARRR